MRVVEAAGVHPNPLGIHIPCFLNRGGQQRVTEFPAQEQF